ncbi:hypothetical protein [Corynebacterium kefirresidentii]|uniref:hypothetical protein n=1 Tax=Corynebacterium kefirresidentii TaxID=1979527 RepID=UPI001FC8EDC7|nr:hypothetical protein [Corynebacterium kefirresidentii]
MTNPTRQEILDAHYALEKLCNRLPGTRRAKMTILAALPPKPQPTMAEVEWDSDDHHLAEAETPKLGKVVMLHPESETQILCLRKWYGPYRAYSLAPANLTPTGRRYTLTEVQE